MVEGSHEGTEPREMSLEYSNKVGAASGTALRIFFRFWREEKRLHRARNKNSEFKPAPHRHGGAPQLASGAREKDQHLARSKNSELSPAPHRHGGA